MTTSVIRDSWLLRFVIKPLPEGLKRTIILSSLVARVERIDLRQMKKEDLEILHGVNSILKLATKDEALHLGVGVKNLIWGDIEPIRGELVALIEHAESDNQLQNCAVKIAAAMPDWMRWQSIVPDLVRVFQHQNHAMRA